MAACLAAHAQEEVDTNWIVLPVTTLKTSEPKDLVELSKGNVNRTNGQNQISTTMSQPVKLEYKLADEFPLFVRYQGEARLQTLEDPMTNFNLGNQLDISHTTTIVAEFPQSFTAMLLIESRTILPQDAMLQWAHRAEVIAKKIKLFGKVDFTATAGVTELTSTGGTSITQQYLRAVAEQRIGTSPVRLRLSPSLTDETLTTAAQISRTMTSLDSAILFDANTQTVLSLGAVFASNSGYLGSDATGQRTLYSQIEHLATPTTLLRLRANYEEGTVRQALNASAIAFIFETSFSLSQTLKGGLQLQHHVREFLSSPYPFSETVLSFSLGGSF